MSHYISYLAKIITTTLCLFLSYFEPISGAIHIFLTAFLVDFITGLLVSFSKGERFKSSKARWSFSKLLCYVGTLMFMLFTAKNMVAIDPEGSDYQMFLWIIKVTVYVGIWFETKSIIENMLMLLPENRFLQFCNYFLRVEFAKKIPGLASFLKENKSKDDDEQHL